ncbi:MAG TPA: glycosyl hydrolase family 18 protein [Candidatus Dormibacteraeota bacterium]|nr:glycosyl hydrolase family 18 protein [Candidatus Dormibacteraeota bacterium]
MHRYTNALMAALIVGASISAVPVNAAVNTLKQDQTQPRIMSVAAQAAAAPYSGPALEPRSGGRVTPLYGSKTGIKTRVAPGRDIFGFVNAGNLGDSNVGYTTWNYNMLTTIAYFGIQVNSGDGHLVTTDTGWAVMNSQTMTNFINLAHANGVRVLMSLDLHDFGYSATSQICNGLQPTSRAATVSWAWQWVQNIGFDGVNIDYEGTNAYCADHLTNRDELVSFASELRAAAPAGMYIAIDTYSGSAEDNQEFFNISGLAPYVDSFFVMAYDMDYSNYPDAPLNCSSYCFNPISPLRTYRFNDTLSMQQYTALAPASKVILGQPLYGRRGCVPNLTTAHQYPVANTNFVSPTYAFASTIPSQTGVSKFAAHRDPNEGVAEWDTWFDSDWNCNREQYFDDTYSLSQKFSLVNSMGLRGVGFFTLDYAGGSPSLWNVISTYFFCPALPSAAATVTTTEFSVTLSAGGCSVARYDAQIFDNTLNQGWGDLNPGPGNATTLVADGYAGHNYAVRVRTHSTAGQVSAWAIVNVAIDPAATVSRPFKGLYTLDPYGGVHLDDSGPLSTTAYWSGQALAREAHAWPGANSPQSGFVLDGYGGLHAFGAPGLAVTPSMPGPYWKGWDIARDFAFLPDGTGGFVLDGWGGLHQFRLNGNTAPLVASGGFYHPHQDTARRVVIFPDGSGGYVMNNGGGIYPFGINGPGPAASRSLATTGFWPGQNVARDIKLIPGNGSFSGYVLDMSGALHPFHPTGDGSVMPANILTSYWGGKDQARAVFFMPGSATAGYTLDAWGGEHPFGGAAPIVNYPYWPNSNTAIMTWGG